MGSSICSCILLACSSCGASCRQVRQMLKSQTLPSRLDDPRPRSWPEGMLAWEMAHDPAPRLRADLDTDPRDGGVLLRLARRFRSRCRHALWLRAGHCIPKYDHEFDRTDLGWERDVARVRWARPAGSLPARLRHHHSGYLFPDPRYVACTGVPRRCLRVSLPRWRA